MCLFSALFTPRFVHGFVFHVRASSVQIQACLFNLIQTFVPLFFLNLFTGIILFILFILYLLCILIYKTWGKFKTRCSSASVFSQSGMFQKQRCTRNPASPIIPLFIASKRGVPFFDFDFSDSARQDLSKNA